MAEDGAGHRGGGQRNGCVVVIRKTRELLATMAKLNHAVPSVVLGILDDSLTPEKQIEFGDLLIETGRLLQDHAHVERALIIDSEDAPPDANG